MPKKSITITVHSTPTSPEFGYGDRVIVRDDSGTVWYTGAISTCPNPYRVQKDASGNIVKTIPWEQCYAWIAPGQYEFRYYYSPKLGRCLLVNNGGKVTTRNPNVNHGGEKYATEVLVHKGGYASVNQKWRGSRACITVPPAEWDAFMSCFKGGDIGPLTIVDGDAAQNPDANVTTKIEDIPVIDAPDYVNAFKPIQMEESMNKIKLALDKLPGNKFKTIVGAAILVVVWAFETYVGDVPAIQAPGARDVFDALMVALGGLTAGVGVLHKILKLVEFLRKK